MKKHTCPTCAGQLIINQERQMYECPFCGVTFDYEYFREDDVLARADRFLKRGEWGAAADAFDFMLAKEPHNFVALRGKILAVSRMHTLADMANLKYQEKVNLLRVMPFIENAIENSEGEKKAYFEKVKKLYESAEEYKKEKGLAEKSGLIKRRQDVRISSEKNSSANALFRIFPALFVVAYFLLFFVAAFFDRKGSIRKPDGSNDILLILIGLIGLMVVIFVGVLVGGLVNYIRVRLQSRKNIAEAEKVLQEETEVCDEHTEKMESAQKQVSTLFYELRKIERGLLHPAQA